MEMFRFNLLPASIVLFTIGKSTPHPCNPGVFCPFNWEPWGDSCYKLTTQPLNWTDAGSMCQAMGGEMFAPSSEEENDYMLTKTSDRLWINCSDIQTEGEWICNKGTKFMNWYQPHREPDGGTRENCALIIENFSGRWVDVMCHQKHFTLCKGQQVMMRSWRLLQSCLMGYILQEFPTGGGVRDCAVMCAYEPRCRSFNVLHFAGGERVCQLNNGTRFDVDHVQFSKMNSLCIYGEK